MDNAELQHWNTYVEGLQKCFDGMDLRDKVLLEIAPGTCNYAKIYSDAGLSKYIAVEPNEQWLGTAKNKLEFVNAAKEYEYINKPYEDYKCDEKVDVIFSAGLIYHLVSPFHFLEYVANHNAEYIILEHTGKMLEPTYGPVWSSDGFVNRMHYGGLTTERTNEPGMRLTDSFENIDVGSKGATDKKFIPLNVFASCDLIVWCMGEMGYVIDEYNNITTGTKSKNQNCVMRFKRAEDINEY